MQMPRTLILKDIGGIKATAFSLTLQHSHTEAEQRTAVHRQQWYA